MFNSNLGYYGEYCDSCGCPNNMYCIGGRNITAGNLNCVCNDGYDITSSCTKCLPGYGGSKCTKCPVCDSTCGVCSEDIDGTGQCVCNTGFNGYLCNSCLSGYGGSDCQQCPTCVGGYCSQGITQVLDNVHV